MEKMISSMTISLFFLVALVSAAGAGDSAFEQGKHLYTEKCQLCHGVNGKGDGPAASAFTPSPTDFSASSFWQDHDDKAIAHIIEKGHGQMPAFHLTPDEVQAIIDYISHSFKPGS
jgi:mono/diheme cytochrome c family protein